MSEFLDALLWQWPLAVVGLVTSGLVWAVSRRSHRLATALFALQLTLGVVIATIRGDPAPNVRWPIYHNEAASFIVVVALIASGAAVLGSRRSRRSNAKAGSPAA